MREPLRKDLSLGFLENLLLAAQDNGTFGRGKVLSALDKN